LAPVVHGLEAKYTGQVDFVYLDIDDPNTTPFKSQLGYQYQPHLFLLDGGGNVLMQWVGFTGEGELEAALQAVVG
jgi:thioredoxin-like negative regulator of GroEL